MDSVYGGKTSKFLYAINKYAEEQRNKLSQEAERLKEAEKIRVEDEILRDAYNLIRKEMSEMRTKISSDRSRKEIESRKKLFERREEITAKVFDSAKEELIKFANLDEYGDYLKNSAKKISSVLKKGKVTIFIRKQDEKFLETLKEFFPGRCEFEKSDEISLGGIKVIDESMGMIVDETFEAKLLDQKNWFIENSGLSVS